MKWTAGWNMPGYLPESDPETFDNWQDARDYLRDTIDRFWDQDTESCDAPAHKLAVCKHQDATWLEIHTQIGLTTEDQAWTHLTGDNRLVFWIVEANNDAFNIAGGTFEGEDDGSMAGDE